jgi:hypothetical protein
MSALLILSLFFIMNETKQLISGGFDYLLQVWNYLDLIPPLLITAIVILNFLEMDNFPEIRTMHAVAALLNWFKLLYFLRIFSSTGYLVRMIINVIVDMRIFLVVFTIILLGFADAFATLSLGSEESAQYVTGFIDSLVYTYRIALGDYATDTYDDTVQPLTVWIFFLLCTIVNVIVILNLLIAIISDSFSRILENS